MLLPSTGAAPSVGRLRLLVGIVIGLGLLGRLLRLLVATAPGVVVTAATGIVVPTSAWLVATTASAASSVGRLLRGRLLLLRRWQARAGLRGLPGSHGGTRHAASGPVGRRLVASTTAAASLVGLLLLGRLRHGVRKAVCV